MGWNCLFHCVLHAVRPSEDRELKVLIHLLQHFGNIYAQDHDGMTIYDCVRDTSGIYGSFRRDLWVTALESAGYTGPESSTRNAVYTEFYLPQHHLALRHLESWSMYGTDGGLDELRFLARTRWAVKRDILQILSYLQSFREENPTFTGFKTPAPTTRVVGTLRPSLRPQVVVSRVHRPRHGEASGESRTRFMRTVRITRCIQRRRRSHSNEMLITSRCREILTELAPKIEKEIGALEDLQHRCWRSTRSIHLEQLKHYRHVNSSIFAEECFGCYRWQQEKKRA